MSKFHARKADLLGKHYYMAISDHKNTQSLNSLIDSALLTKQFKNPSVL